MNNFSLILCTYQRPRSLERLLVSIISQIKRPNHILIIDGSEDSDTEVVISNQSHSHLTYFKVPPEHRGLTKQRNYGISKLPSDTAIVCFLDDDTILEPDYFEQLAASYQAHLETQGLVAPEAMAMGKLVVFSELGPGKETITHKETGLLCNPHDPNSIAEQIVWGFDNQNIINNITEKGITRIKNKYRLDLVAKHNILFYASL